MERDWRDFKSRYGNIEGARSAFEIACETLFRKIYFDKNVQQVKVKVGDGGIDIFVGELGISPITIIQCKFFLEEFGDIQYGQIRKSFEKARSSQEYELKEWILCLPITLNIEQNKWWAAWKKRKEIEHKIDEKFIQLKNGNALIDLFKEYDLYNTAFQLLDSILIKETHDKVSQLFHNLLPSQSFFRPNTEISSILVLFSNYTEAASPFYLDRTVDAEFVKKVRHSNVWVHGISGAGKTALILRAMLNNNFNYLYCDCSPVDIYSADDIIQELKYTLIEQYNLQQRTSETNKIKELCNLLQAPNINKNIIFIIDEISFPNTQVEKDFGKILVKLATYYHKQAGPSSLKFIISTIPAPSSMIEDKGKASEHFSYVSVDGWKDNLPDLLSLLLPALKLSLSEDSKNAILDGAQSSPRLLKNILRKLASCDEGIIVDQTVSNYISEAKAEYF